MATSQNALTRSAPWMLTIALFVVWEVICRGFKIPAYLMPAPSAIWASGLEFASPIMMHATQTLMTTLTGFALAVVVGMAFQAANLLPWRTTLDNVMLPLEIVEPFRSNLRKNKKKYIADAEALLAKVGLAGYGDKFPWELSGGMQQRASICRALIHQPRLLMLDEPFGALDAFTREELWCMLRDLWQQQPFTVVLVTHDLREAVFLADTVFVMSKRPGRILVRKEIDLPRPRPLDVTYTEAFATHVHELREHIGRLRES